MSDTSSVASSVGAFIGRQVNGFNKAKAATSASFTSALHDVETAVGLRRATGFTTSGPTYEANTIAGRTKAAFDNAIATTKSVLHIKP